MPTKKYTFLEWLDSVWKSQNFNTQEKIRELNLQKKGVVALAGYYFLQLFNYRLLAEIPGVFNIPPGIAYEGRLWQIIGTIAGALAAALILWWLRYGPQKKSNTRLGKLIFSEGTSIRNVLNYFSLLSLISILLFIYSLNAPKVQDSFFFTARFLFGVAWAPSIGLMIVWACESTFLHLRTSAALYIGILGFTGACLGSLLGGISLHFKAMVWIPTAFFATALTVVFAQIILLWKRLPEDALLVKKRLEKNNAVPIRKLIAQKAKNLSGEIRTYKKIILASFCIGLSVQYFTFFVNYYPKLSNKNIVIVKDKGVKVKELKNDTTMINYSSPLVLEHLLFFNGYRDPKYKNEVIIYYEADSSLLAASRYLGMIIGCILLIWIGKESKNERISRFKKPFYRNRQKTIALWLILQFIIFSGFFLWFTTGRPIYYWWVSLPFSFIIGIFCAIWIPVILHVAENFNHSLRPWITLLAPNFYRASEYILQKRAEIEFHVCAEYSRDISIAVFVWGLIFIAFAFLGLMSMKNSYERDPLHIPNDENLADSATRQKIKKANQDSGTKKDFFDRANKILNERFLTVLQEQYYLNAIYFQEKDDKLTSSTIEVNQNAYYIYISKQHTVHKKPHRLHLRLLQGSDIEPRYESLVLRMLHKNQERIKGGLMWMPGISRRLLDAECVPEGYEVFDLTLLDTDRDELEKNIDILNATDPEEAVKLFRNMESARDLGILEHSLRYQHPIQTPPDNPATLHSSPIKLNDDDEKQALLRTLTFFKIEAERHDPERYYLYIIKPYTSNASTILIIKTVVPFSQKRLEQLRTLIGFMESEWEKKKLKEDWEYMMMNQSHTMKHTFSDLSTKLEEISAFIPGDARIEQMQSIIEYLKRVNNFNLSLMRAGDLPPDKWDYVTKEYLQISTCIGLDEIMHEIIKEVLNSLVLFQFSEAEHERKVEEMLLQMLSIEKWTGIRLRIVETGLRIVLTDLLKNAIRHTHEEHPQIRIFAAREAEFTKVWICNNIEASEKDRKDFNDKFSNSKFGMRTVWQILRFKYLVDPEGTQQINLYMEEKEKSLPGETAICLTIPNNIIV